MKPPPSGAGPSPRLPRTGRRTCATSTGRSASTPPSDRSREHAGPAELGGDRSRRGGAQCRACARAGRHAGQDLRRVQGQRDGLRAGSGCPDICRVRCRRPGGERPRRRDDVARSGTDAADPAVREHLAGAGRGGCGARRNSGRPRPAEPDRLREPRPARRRVLQDRLRDGPPGLRRAPVGRSPCPGRRRSHAEPHRPCTPT